MPTPGGIVHVISVSATVTVPDAQVKLPTVMEPPPAVVRRLSPTGPKLVPVMVMVPPEVGALVTAVTVVDR